METQRLIKEFNFKGIRSSGSGGQHVNKVASKVQLIFNLLDSFVLTEEQKKILIKNLASRLTKEGVLILQCGDTRSQHKNKELVINRALTLIKNNLIVQKKRVPTKIPKSLIRKRLNNKRIQSERKTNRKKPDLN